MKKLILLLVLAFSLLFTTSSAIAEPTYTLDCIADLDNDCEYFAEYYQKCTVMLDSYNPVQQTSSFEVWCNNDLILKDEVHNGYYIPEEVQSYLQLWPNILGRTEYIRVYSNTKVRRYTMRLPHLFGQGPGQGGE